MAYADFNYYRDVYHGTLITEADYARLSCLASAYIDAVTFGNAAKAQPTEKVKTACCALAEQYQKEDKGGEVSGYNNDGYSESYATSGRTPGQRLYSVAAAILAPTGLLYGGV